MFDLGKALMTQDLEVRQTSLNIWVVLMIFLTILKVIRMLISSMKYRIPKILR